MKKGNKHEYTYDGTATNLIDVAKDGTVTHLPDTKIKKENAYMILKQEGRYRAYQFMEKFVKNSRCYAVNAFNSTQSHVQAEEDFLYNVADGKEKIAMTVNGIWWEEEAKSIFTAMQTMDEAYSRANRRFGWMAMPFYTESDEERQQILLPQYETQVFISKNIAPAKVEVAKKFLQFSSTDAMLLAHAEEISVPRALKMLDISLLEKSTELTPFGRSVVTAMNEAKMLYKQGVVNYGKVCVERCFESRKKRRVYS